MRLLPQRKDNEGRAIPIVSSEDYAMMIDWLIVLVLGAGVIVGGALVLALAWRIFTFVGGV